MTILARVSASLFKKKKTTKPKNSKKGTKIELLNNSLHVIISPYNII